MKKPLTLLLGLFTLFAVIGCSDNNEEEVKPQGGGNEEEEVVTYKYGEDEMYEKIWESKVIHNESVVFTEGDDGRFSGRLLYTPKRIICVRDNTLKKVYPESEYYIEGDRIYMSDTGTMPRLTKRNISCEDIPVLIGGTYEGRYGDPILFTEGAGILMYQTMVTYEHEDSWFGTVPEKKGLRLPKLYQKLQTGEDLYMVTNGDSIFCGCNTSGLKGIEPFQDPFPTGFANEIKRKFGNEVVHYKTSKGGELSNWGKENVGPNVNTYVPDLVVIGFGMNDGSWKVHADDYVENIEFMVKSIQHNCPNASIIVCATILASEVSPQANGVQASYLEPLLELENSYSDLVVMDMTTFSADIFTKKQSLDLFANNINHPADWLARQYVSNLMNVIDK